MVLVFFCACTWILLGAGFPWGGLFVVLALPFLLFWPRFAPTLLPVYLGCTSSAFLC